MLDARLVQLITRLFGIPEENVTPELSRDTLQTWDSLHHFKLILSVEEAYHLRFPTSEIPNLVSVEGIQKALNRLAK